MIHVGGVSATYNTGGRTIERNRNSTCANCPYIYLSNESYKCKSILSFNENIVSDKYFFFYNY